MSQEPMETVEKEWSDDEIRQLLHAMKRGIAKRRVDEIYSKGQRTLNWNKVAFQPYSAEECKQKWQDLSQKIRKVRTLTELIVEAEVAVNNTFKKPEPLVRPTPPNAIFVQEKIGRFQKKHPELSRQKLLTLANKKYARLPPHKKAIYIKKFQLAKEEYMRRKLLLRKPYNRAKYLNTRGLLKSCHPSSSREKESHTGSDRERHSEEEEGRTTEEWFEPDSDPPEKPPVNAYQLFCKEHWAYGDGLPNQVLLCAQRWQKLTQREKDEYRTRCDQLKSEHEEKLREYLCDYSKEEQQQIIKQYGFKKPPKATRARKPARKFPGEPPMPSRSGHLMFCSKQIKLLTMILNSRERMSKASQMWHSLSDKEKDNYKREANRNFREYIVKLQMWFKTLTASDQEDYREQNRRKCQYIKTKVRVRSKETITENRPSDSEDEILEDSSSDEVSQEDEEEEDDGDIFTMCL